MKKIVLFMSFCYYTAIGNAQCVDNNIIISTNPNLPINQECSILNNSTNPRSLNWLLREYRVMFGATPRIVISPFYNDNNVK